MFVGDCKRDWMGTTAIQRVNAVGSSLLRLHTRMERDMIVLSTLDFYTRPTCRKFAGLFKKGVRDVYRKQKP